jgi:hypothetical protein
LVARCSGFCKSKGKLSSSYYLNHSGGIIILGEKGGNVILKKGLGRGRHFVEGQKGKRKVTLPMTFPKGVVVLHCTVFTHLMNRQVSHKCRSVDLKRSVSSF